MPTEKEEKIMKEFQIILKHSGPETFIKMDNKKLIDHISNQIAVMREYSYTQRDEEVKPLLEKYALHIRTQVENYYHSGKFPKHGPSNRITNLIKIISD